jgi:hypothetical protein
MPSSTFGFVLMDQPAMITEAVARLRGTDGAFAIPLLTAALASEIRVLAVMPGGRVPVRLLEHTCPPTVIIASGDPGVGHITPTPESFPQARRLLGWAASTIIHATGGQEAHYRAVVEAAKLVRRVLLIETATAQEDAWTELVQAVGERRQHVGRRIPTVVISARLRGGAHPKRDDAR